MATGNSDQEKTKMTIFGYPLRDWIILLTFLGVGTGTAFSVGGTPGQTRDAIQNQTDTLSTQINSLVDAIRMNTRVINNNSLRLDEREVFERQIQVQIDSLQSTMLKGLSNLDGYFQGRLHQQREKMSTSQNPDN